MWFGLWLLSLAGCGKSDDSTRDGSGSGGTAGRSAGHAGSGASGGSSGGQDGGASGTSAKGGSPGSAGLATGGAGADGTAGGAGAEAGADDGGTGGNSAGQGGAGASAGGASGGASGGVAGMGNASGDGIVPATCSGPGACDAASCASKACFDADHCAASDTAYWGGEWNEYANDLAIAQDGGRVLVGSAQPSTGGNDEWDVFVAKLAADGSEVWSQRWGSEVRDNGYAVLLDPAGNIYLGGSSTGEFDGEPNAGEYDTLLVKLDPGGTRLYSRLFGTSGWDFPYDLAFDREGNVLVAGRYAYDPDTKESEAFVARVSPSGELLDTVVMPLDLPAEAQTIDVDADGNWLVSGQVRNEEFDANLFAMKLTPAGDVLWTIQWGSENHDFVNAAVIDAAGDLVVSGTSNGSIAGHPTPVVGNWSAFVSRVSAAGELRWTRQYGGGRGLDMRGGDLTLTAGGDLLLSGAVLGELMLDTPSLGSDAYLMRLCPDGSTKSIEQWSLGGDDWSYAVKEAPDGTVVLGGYTNRDPEPEDTPHYIDAFVVTVAPE